MAIYRKFDGGIWHFSVYVPGRKRRLRGSCGTANREEAELIERSMRLAATRSSPRERLIRLINAMFPEDEELRDSMPITLFVAEVSRCRAAAGHNLSPSTVRTTQINLNRFVRWCTDDYPKAADIHDVDRMCAQAYSSYLVRIGTSTKTRRNIIGDLVTAWNELKRQHDGLDNPWPLAMPAKGGDEERGEAFTPEQARRIFAAGDADGHGWGLAARISAATGLRMGDVLTLRHEDIDNGTIHLKPRKTARHGIATILPLPADIVAMIGAGTGYVLPQLAAEYRPGHLMSHPFCKVLAAAGIDNRRYTFHSFRHFFRTQLARAGISDDVAMRLGGWTKRDTAARYDHDDHREQLAAAIAAAWKA
jgi:integrase